MKFANRLKKEVSEGALRAFLIDIGFTVVPTGVESLVREIESMDEAEYRSLDLTKNMRSLPDLIAIDRARSKAHLVEVKYRSTFKSSIFNDLKDQVDRCGSLVLVCITPNMHNKLMIGNDSDHIRAIGLRSRDGLYEVEVYDENDPITTIWVPVTSLSGKANIWETLPSLSAKFLPVDQRKNATEVLDNLVRSVSGLFSM